MSNRNVCGRCLDGCFGDFTMFPVIPQILQILGFKAVLLVVFGKITVWNMFKDTEIVKESTKKKSSHTRIMSSSKCQCCFWQSPPAWRMILIFKAGINGSYDWTSSLHREKGFGWTYTTGLDAKYAFLFIFYCLIFDSLLSSTFKVTHIWYLHFHLLKLYLKWKQTTWLTVLGMDLSGTPTKYSLS